MRLRNLLLFLLMIAALASSANEAGRITDINLPNITIVTFDTIPDTIVLVNVNLNGTSPAINDAIIYTLTSPSSIVCIATVNNYSGTVFNVIVNNCEIGIVHSGTNVTNRIKVNAGGLVYVRENVQITGKFVSDGGTAYCASGTFVGGNLIGRNNTSRFLVQNTTIAGEVKFLSNTTSPRLENCTVLSDVLIDNCNFPFILDGSIGGELKYNNNSTATVFGNLSVTGPSTYANNGFVNISGGTYTGNVTVRKSTATVSINQGTYNGDLTIKDGVAVILTNPTANGTTLVRNNTGAVDLSFGTYNGDLIISGNQEEAGVSDIELYANFSFVNHNAPSNGITVQNSFSYTPTSIFKVNNNIADGISVDFNELEGDIRMNSNTVGDQAIFEENLVVGNVTTNLNNVLFVGLNDVSGDIKAVGNTVEVQILDNFIGGDLISKDNSTAILDLSDNFDILGSLTSTNDGDVNVFNNTIAGDLTITTPVINCSEGSNSVMGTNSGCPPPPPPAAPKTGEVLTDISTIDHASNGVFVLYPNPGNDFVMLQNLPVNTVKIELIDLSGQLLISKSINDTKDLQLNTSDLATGLYFIQIVEMNAITTYKWHKTE